MSCTLIIVYMRGLQDINLKETAALSVLRHAGTVLSQWGGHLSICNVYTRNFPTPFLSAELNTCVTLT